MSRTPPNVARRVNSDAGMEFVHATSDAASAVADGTPEKCDASLEAAVERTLSDLAAEGRRERE